MALGVWFRNCQCNKNILMNALKMRETIRTSIRKKEKKICM